MFCYGFTKDELYPGDFPSDFVIQNLMDPKSREVILNDIASKYCAQPSVLSYTDAAAILNKIDHGQASVDDMMALLHHIFFTFFTKETNNLFGTEKEHELDQPIYNNPDTDRNNDEPCMVPDDPLLPYYTIDCNEAQLKNRIKLLSFLYLIEDSPFLRLPMHEE